MIVIGYFVHLIGDISRNSISNTNEKETERLEIPVEIHSVIVFTLHIFDAIYLHIIKSV